MDGIRCIPQARTPALPCHAGGTPALPGGEMKQAPEREPVGLLSAASHYRGAAVFVISASVAFTVPAAQMWLGLRAE